MDALATARQIASAHPSAKLPCPFCVVTVKAENLDAHVAKVHAAAMVVHATSWTGKGLLGVLPCSLVLDGDALVFRYGLGLLSRRIALDGAIEVGAITSSRVAAGMSSYADDMNVRSEDVRTGTYLRIAGTSSITIGCSHGTQFAAHWDANGWRRGPRRRGSNITVERTALVAIEYALAARGRLTPSTVAP